MIFNPAFKRIWSLFRHQCSFPSVHLSRVEWQVSVTLLMSSIAWLEANTFMKAYGIHSLTKPNKYIMREDNKHDECAVNAQLLQYPKGDTRIKRNVEDRLILLNVWHHLNVC